MRIPTLQAARQWIESLSQRQAEQARLQDRIASGLRVGKPSDDPAAAAAAELARSGLRQLEQERRAAAVASGALEAADAALSRGIGVLQSVRELLVGAGNGSYGPAERQALAVQLRGARDDLLGLANATDPTGQGVFGPPGWQSAPAAPERRAGRDGQWLASLDGRAVFHDLPSGNGVFTTASAPANQGQGWIDVGTVVDASRLTSHGYQVILGGTPDAPTYSVQDTTTGATLAADQPWQPDKPLTIDGQQVRIGGTPAAGDRFTLASAPTRSVFDTLQDAIALLEGSPSPAAFHQGLQRTQAGLDRALDAFGQARTRAGESLRQVGAADDALAQGEIAAEAHRSSLRDLDLAAAIGEWQSAQTSGEAALRTYATAQRRSLFDLLG